MLIWQHGYNFLFKINCYKYFKQTYFKLREITNSIVLVKPSHLYIIIFVFTKSVFLLLDVELSLLLSMTDHPYHKLTLILYKHFSGWGWQGGLQCSICRPQDVPDLQKYVLDLSDFEKLRYFNRKYLGGAFFEEKCVQIFWCIITST